MLIQAKDKKASELYHLMTQIIVPRPVAWTLSQNPEGKFNLAPFSYFNGISSDPPILMMSVGVKRSGPVKDTVLNIKEKRFFVVHIASAEHADLVTSSADEFDRAESEIEKLKLDVVPEEGWPLPRLKTARVAMLCELSEIHEIGAKPQHIIYGEIKSIWLSPDVTQTEGPKIIIDPEKLNPLARLGRSQYASIRKL